MMMQSPYFFTHEEAEAKGRAFFAELLEQCNAEGDADENPIAIAIVEAGGLYSYILHADTEYEAAYLMLHADSEPFEIVKRARIHPEEYVYYEPHDGGNDENTE